MLSSLLFFLTCFLSESVKLKLPHSSVFLTTKTITKKPDCALWSNKLPADAVPCAFCYGTGYIPCRYCYNEGCENCRGTTLEECPNCGGTGAVVNVLKNCDGLI